VTELTGNLGLVIGAGGGSLTLFDAVRRYGGRPADYCGSAANPMRLEGEEPHELVHQKPGVDRSP